MNEVHECIAVLCPYDQAPQAAVVYLDSLPLEGGGRVAAIRAEAGDLAFDSWVGMTLTYRPQLRFESGNVVMDVRWGPHDGGPFPGFTGTLSVEDAGGNFSRLGLDGSYAPALGFAGQLYDAVVGQRIAHAACRRLLDDIKTAFELAFQTGMTIA